MINTLIKTLQIDICYAVNSFIYSFKRLPIIKDLFTNDAYKSKLVKTVIGLIGITVSIFRALFFKFIYFLCIFLLSSVTETNHLGFFLHAYFILTILGMFINNKVLSVSTKKYFSIILFNMDANKFLKSNLIWNLLTNSIANFIFLSIFLSNLTSNSLIITFILLILTINLRVIGETLNIIFYRKYKYIWYSNSKLYFPIVLSLLALCFLPCFNIVISWNIIKIISLVLLIPGIISLIYLFTVKDYRILYKKITIQTQAMNDKNQDDYLKQSMVEVNKKDKKIDNSILEKKEGYELFNTIFFERHKEILLRSAKKYALAAVIIYGIIAYIMLTHKTYNNSVGEFLHLKLSYFIIIMFFINRGSIITQAMFFNCDHAMLSFNFYREPDVILNLFKKRLTTVVKVNLIPAFIIGIGNIVLLLISNNHYNILTLITTFLFIICLSIFFSVHYLVIYYLLQPYNKEMKMKKMSYSIVTILTYIFTYRLSDLILSSEILSIIGIVFVIAYVSVSLLLVYRVSPRTFKLN